MFFFKKISKFIKKHFLECHITEGWALYDFEVDCFKESVDYMQKELMNKIYSVNKEILKNLENEFHSRRKCDLILKLIENCVTSTQNCFQLRREKITPENLDTMKTKIENSLDIQKSQFLNLIKETVKEDEYE